MLRRRFILTGSLYNHHTQGFMRARLFVLAILLYLVATLIFLYPLPSHLGDRVFENGDSHLNIWILGWETHALATKPAQLFDGNIFFPEANALALSELMLPDLAIFAPILALTHNPLPKTILSPRHVVMAV